MSEIPLSGAKPGTAPRCSGFQSCPLPPPLTQEWKHWESHPYHSLVGWPWASLPPLLGLASRLPPEAPRWPEEFLGICSAPLRAQCHHTPVCPIYWKWNSLETTQKAETGSRCRLTVPIPEPSAGTRPLVGERSPQGVAVLVGGLGERPPHSLSSTQSSAWLLGWGLERGRKKTGRFLLFPQGTLSFQPILRPGSRDSLSFFNHFFPSDDPLL